MHIFKAALWVTTLSAFLCLSAWAQDQASMGHPPAILPVKSEAAPKLTTYPPLPEPLARGVVIIQYQVENVRIMPIFGKAADDVSPRIGHLHVTVDDWQGTWAHTSADPIIVVGLKPGPHKILLEVADPTHAILTSATVAFTVPEKKPVEPHAH